MDVQARPVDIFQQVTGATTNCSFVKDQEGAPRPVQPPYTLGYREVSGWGGSAGKGICCTSNQNFIPRTYINVQGEN